MVPDQEEREEEEEQVSKSCNNDNNLYHAYEIVENNNLYISPQMVKDSNCQEFYVVTLSYHQKQVQGNWKHSNPYCCMEPNMHHIMNVKKYVHLIIYLLKFRIRQIKESSKTCS